jgi:phage terminase small subunit
MLVTRPLFNSANQNTNSLTMTKSKTTPPDHLKPATADWWKYIVGDYELESHHLRLLQLACEAWDRAQSAREIIDRDGISYVDRFGAPRSRPEIAVERDCRIGFARLVRELQLDGAGTPEPTRLPALR